MKLEQERRREQADEAELEMDIRRAHSTLVSSTQGESGGQQHRRSLPTDQRASGGSSKMAQSKERKSAKQNRMGCDDNSSNSFSAPGSEPDESREEVEARASSYKF